MLKKNLTKIKNYLTYQSNMANIKNQFSFRKERKKRMRCGNCWRFIDYQSLDQTENKNVICSRCKTINPITIPVREDRGSQKGVSFGPNNSLWTAVSEQ